MVIATIMTKPARDHIPPKSNARITDPHPSSDVASTSHVTPAIIPHPTMTITGKRSQRADLPVSCNLLTVAAGITTRYITGRRNAKEGRTHRRLKAKR